MICFRVHSPAMPPPMIVVSSMTESVILASLDVPLEQIGKKTEVILFRLSTFERCVVWSSVFLLASPFLH